MAQADARDFRPVTVDEVRAWALSLPRTEEHLIRDYIKFRVGQIVYATVSPDETILGFGFPGKNARRSSPPSRIGSSSNVAVTSATTGSTPASRC